MTTLATSAGVSERESADVIHWSRARCSLAVSAAGRCAAASKPTRIAQARPRRPRQSGADSAPVRELTLVVDVACELDCDVGGPVVVGKCARHLDGEQRRLGLPLL